ncbi:transglutaminase domain-containing protein [Paenibacillus daejeonensis]|uniref:transglutaminase domain-containing protein n=1 Tax=Paenibacillus daejeonensis TaxID=135193 RepID=UPI000374529F|nr:transglutaminase-like domain-containing protein [Paenibacillus daejeonensis]
MAQWLEPLLRFEWISILLLLVLAGSLIQGLGQGASGSAKRLFRFLWESLWIVISLLLAAQAASYLSPHLQRWLIDQSIRIPDEEMNMLLQIWYAFITGLRDFALLRFGVLFLLAYAVLRGLFGLLTPIVLQKQGTRGEAIVSSGWLARVLSRLTGALIGAIHGIGRAFVLLALFFIYVTLLPTGPFADQIQASPTYRETTERLIAPLAGPVLTQHGPVITKAVETEFRQMLQRRYEIIDHAVPAEIGEAARHVTEELSSDEDKARALYDWVGTRIAYDWDKANDYIDYGTWREQTPQDTFDMRQGVCIDVARLYAVMARSVGLDVRVVTGMGGEGGNLGPHAWNEVRVDGNWLPLDATWARSGDWFNPPNFDDTHLRDA